MKLLRIKLRILLIMIFLLLLSSACGGKNIEYRLTTESFNITPGQSYSVSLMALEEGEVIENFEFPEGIIYSISEGAAFAEINSATGDFTVSESAVPDTIIKISASNGEELARINFIVVKIAVESILITSEKTTADIGQEIQINGTSFPDNSTYPSITYQIISGAEYGTIDSSSGLLSVSSSATPDSIISVQAEADGILSNVLSLTVTVVPVSSVNIFNTNQYITVMQGGSLDFDGDVLPINSSYPEITYSISSGSEFGEIDSASGILTVSADTAVNSQISVIASANGVNSSPYVITVVQLTIQQLILSSNKSNVEINGTSDLSVQVLPYIANGINICYEITEGTSYGLIENNLLTIMAHTPSGATLSIVAYAADNEGEIEGTRSNIIEINVYKIEVTNVELFTGDNTLLVEADTVLAFGVNVSPANATIKTAEYIITSGANFASVDRNTGIVTILKNNEDGLFEIKALVDGVYSEIITVTTTKYYYTISNTTYSVFDNSGNIFMNYRNIKLKIKDLPEEAGLTTIIIPNFVKRLIIEGAYSSVSPVTTKNLFFYFYKAGNIDITLINVGIEITAYSAADILDFPENSNAIINVQGDCLLKAGRAINPYFYSADGLYDTGDEDIIYRINGMDGNNGTNGGNAISGYSIEFKGSGSLRAEGGDGSSGSNGGDGADLPEGSSSGTISGNGGCGGSGGNAGYGIYGYNIIINMSISGIINAYSGDAGRGGSGGAKGQIISGCIYGEDGDSGINGDTVSAIAAYNNLSINSGYVYQTNGILQQAGWSIPQYETIDNFIMRMENTYGIDFHIKNDLYSPFTEYPMTKLTLDSSVIFMLRIIDNVLSKYPDNIFREIRNNSGYQVNLYVVNTIKSGTIAGLASQLNNVWLAYSTANIRNIFYSDVENFTFHEITHIIMYNASSSFSETTFTNFNSIYNYVSSGNPTGGVYNPSNGYDKTNSYFLSSYSRRSWKEDVCETFSLISRQSRYWDFLDSGTPIRTKIVYIASAIDNGYETCSFYREEYWERYL